MPEALAEGRTLRHPVYGLAARYSRPRRAGREVRCAPACGLIGWLGRGGKRALSAKGVLRKQDVPAAAAIIGVKAPQAVRSAADLPELHLAWCAAVGMGLLTVEGGKASGDDPNRRAVYQGGIRMAEQGARLVLLMSGQRRV